MQSGVTWGGGISGSLLTQCPISGQTSDHHVAARADIKHPLKLDLHHFGSTVHLPQTWSSTGMLLDRCVLSAQVSLAAMHVTSSSQLCLQQVRCRACSGMAPHYCCSCYLVRGAAHPVIQFVVLFSLWCCASCYVVCGAAHLVRSRQ